MSAEDDKGQTGSFLKRWSRLKRDDSSKPASANAQRPTAPENDGGPSSDQPEAIDLSQLTPIDELKADSDFASYLQNGVPDELRRLAMRKAWTLDPAIRDFVEMAENQYDWNVPGGVPGFGELAAGTDIDALLAQATGQLQAIVEATPEPAAAPYQPQPLARATQPDSDQGLSQVAADADAPGGPVPIAVTNPDKATSAPNASIASDTQPSPARRRRHGSALPRSV